VTGRRVAITGAGGRLGRELVRAFSGRQDEVLALARPEFDITRGEDLEGLTGWRPDVVVNSAAWTDVDGCARDPERAMRINAEAAGAVARAAASAGALIMQISTNEVFDGTAQRPYAEDDEPNPINPYGASKLAGERAVAAANPRHLIVRTAWLFGPRGADFVTKILAAAERARVAGEPLRVVDDEWGNPTWAPSLADAIAALASDPRSRDATVWHLAGEPPTSRLGWAKRVLSKFEVEILPIKLADYPRPSQPPRRAILDCRRTRLMGLALEWMSVAEGWTSVNRTGKIRRARRRQPPTMR
jgi:dTDP-4-dehydrorhamnose reductase